MGWAAGWAGQEGLTALHCAAVMGFADCVAALMDAAADVNLQDKVRLATITASGVVLGSGEGESFPAAAAAGGSDGPAPRGGDGEGPGGEDAHRRQGGLAPSGSGGGPLSRAALQRVCAGALFAMLV
jgi:hypothetical protein